MSFPPSYDPATNSSVSRVHLRIDNAIELQKRQASVPVYAAVPGEVATRFSASFLPIPSEEDPDQAGSFPISPLILQFLQMDLNGEPSVVSPQDVIMTIRSPVDVVMLSPEADAGAFDSRGQLEGTTAESSAQPVMSLQEMIDAKRAREKQRTADGADQMSIAMSIEDNRLTDRDSAQQQNQPQQTGGLFGSTSNTQNTTGTPGGLFGSGNAQPQNALSTGGLFGNSNAPQQNTQSIGGLFGNTSNQQQNQQQNTGGLFGSTNTPQNQQQSTGGLFGNTNPQQTQQQGGGTALGNSSVFGGTLGSTFGGQTQQGSAANNNMFGQQNQNPPPAMGGSLFGSKPGGSTFAPGSAFALQQAQPSAPSLLGATQHAQMNNAAPFGRLSMGQAVGGAPTTVGAVKIDYSTMRPTTRFEDLSDEVKQELEAIDKLIQQQESFSKQIEAFMPKHEENVMSVNPDVELVKSKAEEVESALASDAQGVDAQRKSAEKDVKDFDRVQRVITNLTLPQSYQNPNMSIGGLSSVYGSQQRSPQPPAQQQSLQPHHHHPQQPPSNAIDGADGSNYDADLIGNYFTPMAAELQKTVQQYARNLGEIEGHMRVVEGSTVAQAQQLALRKAGVPGGGGAEQAHGDETVRELADTLRGFEESILGVASVVGECREGVNHLVLGRLSGQLG